MMRDGSPGTGSSGSGGHAAQIAGATRGPIYHRFDAGSADSCERVIFALGYYYVLNLRLKKF